jgi:hypothetical protein
VRDEFKVVRKGRDAGVLAGDGVDEDEAVPRANVLTAHYTILLLAFTRITAITE